MLVFENGFGQGEVFSAVPYVQVMWCIPEKVKPGDISENEFSVSQKIHFARMGTTALFSPHMKTRRVHKL